MVKYLLGKLSIVTSLMVLIGLSSQIQAAEKKPIILVIMGDDVGWFNVGAYHRGIKGALFSGSS